MLTTTQNIGFMDDRRLSFYDAIVGQGLSTNLVLCLDAGDIQSYPATGGQKWLDRTAGGYDFFLGADVNAAADDPTFTGTPGRASPGDYWSFDGGDFFRYDTTNETWMNNLHKDNATFTLAMWVYIVSGALGPAFMCTFTGANTEIGAYVYVSSGNKISLAVGNGTGTTYALLPAVSDVALSAPGWHFVAVSVDETGATGFYYADGNYMQVASANTFTATYTTPSAAAATFTAEIGAFHGTSPAANGSRLGGGFAWTAALSKAQLDLIYAATKSRFS